MRDLTVCSGCRRHVRIAETECPFCRRAVPKGNVGEPIALTPLASTTLGLGRAARYRANVGQVATVVACAAAIACERREPATVVPVEGQSKPTADASAPTPTTTATPSQNKSRGQVCNGDGECVSGLACCLTQPCGGRAAQAGNCKNISTCEASPCPAIAFPPYGCAFPCEDVVSV
jgi:hypothetical protein